MDINWEPIIGGVVVTWTAMDKNGHVARFGNKTTGSLPKILLAQNDIEIRLDRVTDFLYEESKKYTKISLPQRGQYLLDIFSSEAFKYLVNWNCSKLLNKKMVEAAIDSELLDIGALSDYALTTVKGFFVYEALYSYVGETDKPVGYDEDYKEGDYFRFLMPTIYASIEDLPQDLRKIVVVSDTVDFTKDRFFKNEMIDTYFTHMYEG